MRQPMCSGPALAMLFLCLLLVASCSGGHVMILMWPSYSIWHNAVHVARELEVRGHKVTFVLPNQAADDPRTKQLKLNILRYSCLDDVDTEQMITGNAVDTYFQDLPNNFTGETILQINDAILRDAELLQNIRAVQPDLFVMSATFIAPMLTILPYRLGIPYVFFSLEYDPQFHRAPVLPSVVPYYPFHGVYTDDMTVLERVANTINTYRQYLSAPFGGDDLVQLYAPEAPPATVTEIQSRGLLWLVEEDELVDYIRPSMPNVKRIGCLLPTNPQPLPALFQTFMDESSQGAVIVSFGTHVPDLPDAIFHRFLEAFRKTPFRVVMRSPRANPDPDKFLFSDWLPQWDLLRHPQTRLFITHCGANGNCQGVTAGVPMIGFPVFVDQFYNAARLEAKGYGVKMDLKTFTSEELATRMMALDRDLEVRRRLQRAVTIRHAQRAKPAEEAAFWVDHVMQHGGEHLRSRGMAWPLYRYLGLDVLGLLLVVLHVVLVATVCTCRAVFRVVVRGSQRPKQKLN